MRDAYSKTATDVLGNLDSSEHGLTAIEAAARLERFGPNKLPEGKIDSIFEIFLRQFRSPLIYVLIGAAVVVYIMDELLDSAIILFVLFFNAVVGTIQEGKAQDTLRAIKQFGSSQATVIRDEKEIVIPDTEVVPGDIILVQEGEKVSADARILTEHGLRANEASLTGESEPVTKITSTLEGESLAPADQTNMLFKGTSIVAGSSRAIVVTTGIHTELGRIAQKISEVDTEIPLKNNIKYLSRLIIIVVAVVSVGIITFGTMIGRPLDEMFRTAVSLAVSVIPEGLPIVMTLVLAQGVWRMSKRNALVKKLQAVESLGQTRVIAVDKTGTLTKNEMVLQKIYAGNTFFDVTGSGYEPSGTILHNGNSVITTDYPELVTAGKVAAYCANARLYYNEQDNVWKIGGDPTEAALLVLGEKLGFKHDTITEKTPITFDLPFDYSRKYHATVHAVDKTNFVTVVGAPEKVLALCKEKLSEMEAIFAEMAQDGFRVLAFAYNAEGPAVLDPDQMPALTFGGFYGLKDALRPEVKDVVREVRSVGIRMVMITGDHRITAKAVASEAGIWQEGDTVLEGGEVEKMNDFALAENLGTTSVFARVTPEHKLRIIEAFRQRGEVVAMTGDGVNDAPSLVAADLGVAMGRIGTEVAKEAADIILLDDNFGSIVAATEEGRSIYQTIKKVILYLFSTSVGEVLVIIGALVLALPLPILPSQIIWLNFVTDGFLVVALAMEPKEKDLLHKKFEKPRKWIVDTLMEQRILLMATVMTVGVLIMFGYSLDGDVVRASTIALTALAVFQWFNVWNCRSEDESIFSQNPFSNLYLVTATVIVIILQLAALYTPFLQKILHTVPLSLNEWFWVIAFAATIILAEEVRKFYKRRSLVI